MYIGEWYTLCLIQAFSIAQEQASNVYCVWINDHEKRHTWWSLLPLGERFDMIWSWNPIIANPASTARHAATLLPFKPNYCGRKLKWWLHRWYGSPKWVYRGQYILPGFRLGCISYNHAKELFFYIIGHLCVGEVVWCGSRFVTAYGLWNSHIKGLISPNYPKSRFSGWDIFCGWSDRRDSGVRSEFQQASIFSSASSKSGLGSDWGKLMTTTLTGAAFICPMEIRRLGRCKWNVDPWEPLGQLGGFLLRKYTVSGKRLWTQKQQKGLCCA